METLLRAVAVYAFLLFLFRVAGNRTLSSVTTFDFVLLLIISETTEQALMGEDSSFISFVILVTTFLLLNVSLAFLKQRWKWFERLTEGIPQLLIKNGERCEDTMQHNRVSDDDILHAARELQGMERLDQIKHAVLEVSGGITIIPKDNEAQS